MARSSVSGRGESPGSVTVWIGALRNGRSDEAAHRLWDRYFRRLVGLARVRLRSMIHGPDDEEDAALSAFDALCRGVADGRFDRMRDRDDLWRLLAAITSRKVARRIEREGRRKRGGGRVRGEADLAGPDDAPGGALDSFAATTPDPGEQAIIADEMRGLFERLPDESLRLIVLLRLEGHSDQEIATSLDCALRSVERKLERIRLIWAREGGLP